METTYDIVPNKGHYDVHINGKLYCTADSMQEAESEIREIQQEAPIQQEENQQYHVN